MQLTQLLTSAIFGFSILSAAHLGEHHEEPSQEAALQLREFKANSRRGLESCGEKLKRSGIYDRAIARRQATVEKYSKKRQVARDTATVLNTSHLSNSSVNELSPETTIFHTSGTCVLNPEGETGPLYILGEFIRSDLQEDQTVVSIFLDGQFVDVETCEPILNLWWDIWNANATGVYSGIVRPGNGDADDTSNINSTFLRGIQETDSDGVVQFQTVFPGHYAGRTTHHHVVAHLNVTVQPNNTITGSTVAHVGQLFYDQDLIYQVEATYPYNTNTIAITTNAEDRVFGEQETAGTTSDPVFEYVMLGDSLSGGLFGWITIAVNVSATYDPSYSFVYTADGGVAESGGSSPIGSGPRGAQPSGTFSLGPAPFWIYWQLLRRGRTMRTEGLLDEVESFQSLSHESRHLFARARSGWETDRLLIVFMIIVHFIHS